ncbi:bifunctional glutamate--cysteine ligase GshA/glutathione synthetase GshB [Streptococcus halichoeri]|uniref:bifunctional glutamate--cysteine ligase GshA/glutathione synthetase GshB n=1 Tax=Streptococcus halichoeri TaxID=254785 RepID=UPI00135A046E|nr:bifunctional glutamate--cysteine ligase GshA/glutathione synthetase GshB [Streptococcus halichoeri]
MVVNQLLQKLPKGTPILEATFGIEREGLRMSSWHHVAQSAHPKPLGQRDYHPYIQTDFSEAQLELITPISTSTKQAHRRLAAITNVARKSLENNEYIWPLSMPPFLREDDITIAQLKNPDEVRYRQQLAKQYGKKLQSISGIHVNMGLGPQLQQQLHSLVPHLSQIDFQNSLYLKLARQFLNYQWFITYLFGATPLAEAEFYSSKPENLVRSLRASQAYGYSNPAELHVSFASLEDYVHDIEAAVQSKQLALEKEFYSAVRLRGSKHCRDYLTQGITYLEFRSFDLNPFEQLGITQETLDSFHLLLLAFLWLDDLKKPDQELNLAKALNEQIALAHPLAPLPETANPKPLLKAMRELVAHFGLDPYYQELVEQMARASQQPQETISGRLVSEVTNQSLQVFGQEKGQAYQNEALAIPYALQGYEQMELSTQLLMFDALQKGLNLEILDEDDQFLKLWFKDHVELVKNGNMTAKDNFVVPLAMANKSVTKRLLRDAGFPTPTGQEFSERQAAIDAFSYLAQQAIVIKPKSTNFGLGISVFQKPPTFKDFAKAVDLAFAEDSAIIIEEFVAGTEYRFFVLDGKCEAVLLRVPANVVGDGKHTIRQLVAQKNASPLRGSNHRSPLEKIKLGDIERLMLAQEGYDETSILPQGVSVTLRRNSNISTGGDSIDMTDQMDPSYKALAAQMAQACGAWVCGVDLIIPDYRLKASQNEPHCSCIELNFNPLMYMHTYPYKGPGQAITPKILQALFPELTIYPG